MKPDAASEPANQMQMDEPSVDDSAWTVVQPLGRRGILFAGMTVNAGSDRKVSHAGVDYYFL